MLDLFIGEDGLTYFSIILVPIFITLIGLFIYIIVTSNRESSGIMTQEEIYNNKKDTIVMVKIGTVIFLMASFMTWLVVGNNDNREDMKIKIVQDFAQEGNCLAAQEHIEQGKDYSRDNFIFTVEACEKEELKRMANTEATLPSIKTEMKELGKMSIQVADAKTVLGLKGEMIPACPEKTFGILFKNLKKNNYSNPSKIIRDKDGEILEVEIKNSYYETGKNIGFSACTESNNTITFILLEKSMELVKMVNFGNVLNKEEK